MNELRVGRYLYRWCLQDSPGPSGWGALLRYGDKEKELCGGEPNTTNNRMELRAVIEALNVLDTCLRNPLAYRFAVRPARYQQMDSRLEETRLAHQCQ